MGTVCMGTVCMGTVCMGTVCMGTVCMGTVCIRPQKYFFANVIKKNRRIYVSEKINQKCRCLLYKPSVLDVIFIFNTLYEDLVLMLYVFQ